MSSRKINHVNVITNTSTDIHPENKKDVELDNQFYQIQSKEGFYPMPIWLYKELNFEGYP